MASKKKEIYQRLSIKINRETRERIDPLKDQCGYLCVESQDRHKVGVTLWSHTRWVKL